MARIMWKENHVLSIETSGSIFVLAQMLKPPYLMFYNIFREKEDWSNVNLSEVPTLFCYAVTRQFLRNSNITKPKLKPVIHKKLPKYWIKMNPDSHRIVCWSGTQDEKSTIILGDKGGSLIEKDITLSGVHEERVVIPSISFSDQATINSHEFTSLGVYPALNERLYLCYRLGRNVDPMKDLIFQRNIPIEYKRYIDILS